MSMSPRSFQTVTALFERVSGIQLTDAKRSLVIGRLQRLAQDSGETSLDAYVDRLVANDDPDELQRLVDRLTTNETYFFREPKHFEFLAGILAERRSNEPFRVWSAASSSGEEAYSIAMVLAERLGPMGWEIVGTDLSTAMVAAGERALYPMERARHVPDAYLKRWCLKGHGVHEGQLRVAPELRRRVSFLQANLMQDLPDLGRFDVIFLRNVLIYFDPASKQQIAARVVQLLKPGGYLFTGHAETLSHLSLGMRNLQPAVYALA